jgi:hypothetical protein
MENDTVTRSARNPGDLENRYGMIAHNIEKIEHAFSEGRKTNPDVEWVVLVLDLNYDMPRAIAEAASGKEYVEKMRYEINAQNMIPTCHLALTKKDALRTLTACQKRLHELDNRNPKVSSAVEQMRMPAMEGQFWIMAISNGKQLASLTIPD